MTKTLKVLNPANGRLIDTLKTDTRESVAEKFEAARSAQPGWAALPLRRRLETISRFRALLVQESHALASLLTRETGKPITQSRSELKGVLGRIDFFLERTNQTLRAETVGRDPGTSLTEKITHEPLGIIANISAWNYPYFVGSNVFVPALLAGNAVLYKPSEFASLTGLAIARLLKSSGVPGSVFAPIVGKGDIGAILVRQPVDGVFFTGSFGSGMAISKIVAGRPIRLQLEMGGKDPIYVCEDVDISKAAAIADGAFYNTGQSCCSVERIYVHEEIFEQFVEAFVAEVGNYKMGDPMNESTYVGPLTRPSQIHVLEAQIREAKIRGAKVLTGGRRAPGKKAYFEPTVLIGVTNSMALMQEESFGPIVGIMAVSGDDEAVEMMNDTKFGLTAGVYTPDERRAKRILARVKCGSAYWNCCDRVSPRLPWTGVGNSGLGVTLSTYGIETFSRLKAWHLRGQ